MGFQTLIPESNHLELLIYTIFESTKTLLQIADSLWPTLPSGLVKNVWFADSHSCLPWSFSHIGFQTHSWMELARILTPGTLMDSVNIVLGIAHHPTWPIFDLGHDLLSFSHIGFWTRSWIEPARILLHGTLVHHVNSLFGIACKLYWSLLDLGHDLLSISHIVFWTFVFLNRTRNSRLDLAN